MDNRHLVTRGLGGLPSKNHHDDLLSTPPQFFAAEVFSNKKLLFACANQG
jgi:hypothetical protein